MVYPANHKVVIHNTPNTCWGNGVTINFDKPIPTDAGSVTSVAVREKYVSVWFEKDGALTVINALLHAKETKQ